MFLPPADLVEAASTSKGRALSAVKEFMLPDSMILPTVPGFKFCSTSKKEKMKSVFTISPIATYLILSRSFTQV